MRRRSRPSIPDARDKVAGGRTMLEWRKLNAERAIAAGDPPFRYWFSQLTISLIMVARKSGIERDRLLSFDRGETAPTHAEARILATILWCDPNDLCPGDPLDGAPSLGQG